MLEAQETEFKPNGFGEVVYHLILKWACFTHKYATLKLQIDMAWKERQMIAVAQTHTYTHNHTLWTI